MNDIRRVLRYLLLNPWSTKEQICNGADVGVYRLRNMIKDELRLQERRSASIKGGNPAMRYALPEVPVRVPGVAY